MQVSYSKNFKKQFQRCSQKVKKQFQQRLELFINNPFHTQLNLHKLSGKYDGLWSINITDDIRAIIDRSFENLILFVEIGSHSELYK